MDIADSEADIAGTFAWLGASSFTDTEFPTWEITVFAIVVFAISTDLGRFGVDIGIIVVTIERLLTGGADAISIFVLVLAGALWSLALAFVDLSIAVVVCLVVADFFGLGGAFALAWSPLPVCARLLARFAVAFVAGVGGACVAWLCLAGCAALSIATFVSLPVAVVVFCVSANFFGLGGQFALARAPLPTLAGLFSTATDAYAVGVGWPCVAGSLETFVNGAVAIVVFVVAQFVSACGCGFASDFPVLALAHSLPTCTGLPR